MKEEIRHILYWNAGGFAGAVVAGINRRPNGEVFDWAAYIGGCDLTWRTQDAVEWVARHGVKLRPNIAAMLFPNLPAHLYRP